MESTSECPQALPSIQDPESQLGPFTAQPGDVDVVVLFGFFSSWVCQEDRWLTPEDTARSRCWPQATLDAMLSEHNGVSNYIDNSVAQADEQYTLCNILHQQIRDRLWGDHPQILNDLRQDALDWAAEEWDRRTRWTRASFAHRATFSRKAGIRTSCQPAASWFQRLLIFGEAGGGGTLGSFLERCRSVHMCGVMRLVFT